MSSLKNKAELAACVLRRGAGARANVEFWANLFFACTHFCPPVEPLVLWPTMPRHIWGAGESTTYPLPSLSGLEAHKRGVVPVAVEKDPDRRALQVLRSSIFGVRISRKRRGARGDGGGKGEKSAHTIAFVGFKEGVWGLC